MIQERIMPQANLRQDTLRAQIRGGLTRAVTPMGRRWLAAQGGTARLYAYEYDDEHNALINPAIYEFDRNGRHLQRIIEGRSAAWITPHALEIHQADIFLFEDDGISHRTSARMVLSDAEPSESFKLKIKNPMQLSANSLSEYIKRSAGGSPQVIAALKTALYSKYSEPFGALVLALVGMPLALSFGRRSTITSLCFAIGIGLAFWASIGGFRQLGEYGLLPVMVAGWSPVLIFISIGGYLLARART